MRGPKPLLMKTDLALPSIWNLPSGSPQAYVVAVLWVVAAGLLHWALAFAGDDVAPFPMVLAAVVFASLSGGLGPGLAAALLGIVAGWFMRSGRFVPFGTGDMINFAACMAAAGLIAWAAGQYRQLTDRRRSQDELHAIVIDELRHRLKNKTSTIQAIIGLHLRDNPARRDQVFKALAAVNAADNLVTVGGDKAAALADILREELAPYEPSRVAIAGPDVRLPSRLATTMALVLHELATNAAKHGALSRPGGTVMLRWSMAIRNKIPTLTVVWSETGGPPVQPPKTSGFGGVLIENGLPQAVVRREFRPEGLVCTMEIPVPEASDNGAVGQT